MLGRGYLAPVHEVPIHFTVEVYSRYGDMDLAPIWGRCLSKLHYFVRMHQQEMCQSVRMVSPGGRLS